MSTIMQTLVDVQRWIYGSISTYLDAFSATDDWFALATVLPLGIVFGAVHALTPGHGKTVLASYLVGSPMAVWKGAGIAGVLSVTHVASAVILALVGAPLLSRTIVGAGQSEIIEDVSRGLIALIGAWLVIRAVRAKPHLHGEGFAVAFVAGLVPCPLTLFVMFLALARGIPQAGLTFCGGDADRHYRDIGVGGDCHDPGPWPRRRPDRSARPVGGRPVADARRHRRRSLGRDRRVGAALNHTQTERCARNVLLGSRLSRPTVTPSFGLTPASAGEGRRS